MYSPFSNRGADMLFKKIKNISLFGSNKAKDDASASISKSQNYNFANLTNEFNRGLSPRQEMAIRRAKNKK